MVAVTTRSELAGQYPPRCLEAAQRLSESRPHDARARLAAVQHLIAEEQRNLRVFIRESRLPAADLPAADADLVIGSRYIPGGVLQNWPAHRVALSAVANWYVRAVTRMPVHDCTSGFRCWRRDLLARLPLDTIVSDGYAFQVEMLWETHAVGGRIAEVPITFVERRLGTSKMSGRTISESVVLPWRMVARPRKGRKLER